jgi:hypothetical protein
MALDGWGLVKNSAVFRYCNGYSSLSVSDVDRVGIGDENRCTNEQNNDRSSTSPSTDNAPSSGPGIKRSTLLVLLDASLHLMRATWCC